MWWVCALLLGVAVIGTARDGGVLGLGEYFQRAGLAGGFWSIILGAALIAVQTSAAVCSIWPRTRRLGWILTGGLGGAGAAFHVFALLAGDVPAIRL